MIWSDEQLIPWTDVHVTLTLTVPQIVNLIWTIRGAHQEFCISSDHCSCDDLEAPLNAVLPEGIEV